MIEHERKFQCAVCGQRSEDAAISSYGAPLVCRECSEADDWREEKRYALVAETLNMILYPERMH